MQPRSILLALICALSSASAQDGQATGVQKREDKNSTANVVSLHEALKNKDKFKDKPVVLAAYFVTHFEGPWICAENGDWRKRLQTTLSVKNLASAKFLVTPATRSRILSKVGNPADGRELTEEVIGSLALHFGGYENGVPALLTGTFRVGDFSYPNGLNLKDHPYIELTEIREVGADNPQWKAAQPKGEQVGAGQPATRSESKSEGGDKPQPKSEGRSR